VTGEHFDALPFSRVIRLSVNVGPETQLALEHLMKEKNLTLTESLRRLVGYGDVMFRAIHDNRYDVKIHTGEGWEHTVELLG
jgi:hypothetical protein